MNFSPFTIAFISWNWHKIFHSCIICHHKNKGNIFYNVHPHCWTSMDWSTILILLLKHDNYDSNILFLQDHNRHLSFMALILWTTMDQTLILISSLRVNMLFYVVSSSYPTTNAPQNINSITSTWFNIKDWIEIQGKVSQSKHHYFLASPQSQKPPELP